MQTLISALLVFISTSIDYLVVLIILFANQGTRGIKSIYIGQYLGTGILVGVSLIAAYFLNYIPQDWMIGFLGLIPLGLGIRSIFVDEDVDEDSIGNQIKNNQSQIFAITGLTLAMGGDNLGIYIPYFTGVFCNRKVQRNAIKNAEVCHPFNSFSTMRGTVYSSRHEKR
ncbi:cadmium resistance transporter [Listeria innocua]|nr:cadmium resistance transporter [Listeria innocua]EIR6828627.1 cadmium resistance transporter [Listeria innocua]